MTSTRFWLKAALALLLALLWAGAFLFGTGEVDLAVLTAFYAGDRPALADAARLITLLGGWYFLTPVTAIAALVLAVRRKPWLALLVFVGTLVGRALVELQKYQLGRLRPDENPHLVNVYNLSFPSGHAANAVMLYVALPLLLIEDRRRRLWAAIGGSVLALLVGLSRMVLGVHWPSDVVAGWSFGALWTLVLLSAVRHPPRWALRR